jgi:hypothetical protein
VAPFVFTGFFAPVDNLGVFNTVKAERAIPVKFSLNGDQGLDVLAAGSPKSSPDACLRWVPEDDIEQTVTDSTSGLSYNAAEDQYVYVCKTDRAWSDTCRQLMIELTDGSRHFANFKFRQPTQHRPGRRASVPRPGCRVRTRSPATQAASQPVTSPW